MVIIKLSLSPEIDTIDSRVGPLHYLCRYGIIFTGDNTVIVYPKIHGVIYKIYYY